MIFDELIFVILNDLYYDFQTKLNFLLLSRSILQDLDLTSFYYLNYDLNNERSNIIESILTFHFKYIDQSFEKKKDFISFNKFKRKNLGLKLCVDLEIEK